MWFEDFQDGYHGGHLGYQNWKILAIFKSPLCLPPSFPSIWLTVREQITNEDLQDGWRRYSKIVKMADNFSNSIYILEQNNFRNCFSNASHLFWLNPTYVLGGDVVWRISRWPGYRKRTILAILNLYNSPKAPIKFQLNLTYCLGLNVVWRISRWPPWWPSWISERNNFSNSESPLCLPPSFPSIWLTVREQITNEDLQDGWRRCSKIVKMADNFSNSESLCHSDASHQVLAQSDLWPWRPSWIS